MSEAGILDRHGRRGAVVATIASVLFAIAASAPVIAQLQPAPPPEIAALLAADVEVATVSRRLRIANRMLCSATVGDVGMVLHDRRQYGDRASEIPAFAAPDAAVAVVAAVDDGPAALAGLRPGDVVRSVGVDGAAEITAPAVRGDAYAAIERNVALTPMRFRIERAGRPIDLTPRPVAACPGRVEVRTAPSRRAVTDGRTVLIDTGLLNRFTSEEEIAVALAHELAHIVLDHRAQLDAGEDRPSVKVTEIEADRLSVELLDRAGYDPFAVARYWRRHGRAFAPFLIAGITHPRWQRRVELAEAAARSLADRRGASPPTGTSVPPPRSRSR